MAITEYTLSLTDLVTRARQRADMVSSNFVTDTEIQDYIDAAYRHLYMKLVSLNADMFMLRTTALCTDGVDYLDFAKPVLRVRCIEIGDTSATPDTYTFLRRMQLKDVEHYGASANGKGKPYWYKILGSGGAAATYGNFGRMQIMLRPVPDAAYRIRYTAIPYPVKPSEWDDALITAPYTSAGVIPFIPMLDDYLVWVAAREMKDKEESDTSVLERTILDWWQSTEKALTPVNDAEPEVVGQYDGDMLIDPAELSGLTFSWWR